MDIENFTECSKLAHTRACMYMYVPILLELEAGPAAGEGEGVMEEPAGDGTVSASGVWLKSSRQIGELAL